MDDHELSAMAAIHAALEPLDEQARERVMRWAGARFDVPAKGPAGEVPARRSVAASGGENGDETTSFSEIGDLMEVAQPRTGRDRAIVAGYWFKQLAGRPT